MEVFNLINRFVLRLALKRYTKQYQKTSDDSFGRIKAVEALLTSFMGLIDDLTQEEADGRFYRKLTMECRFNTTSIHNLIDDCIMAIDAIDKDVPLETEKLSRSIDAVMMFRDYFIHRKRFSLHLASLSLVTIARVIIELYSRNAHLAPRHQKTINILTNRFYRGFSILLVAMAFSCKFPMNSLIEAETEARGV